MLKRSVCDALHYKQICIALKMKNKSYLIDIYETHNLSLSCEYGLNFQRCKPHAPGAQKHEQILTQQGTLKCKPNKRLIL